MDNKLNILVKPTSAPSGPEFIYTSEFFDRDTGAPWQYKSLRVEHYGDWPYHIRLLVDFGDGNIDMTHQIVFTTFINNPATGELQEWRSGNLWWWETVEEKIFTLPPMPTVR